MRLAFFSARTSLSRASWRTGSSNWVFSICLARCVREKLDVADLAMGLGALDGLGLDLGGHVPVVLEGVLEVVELELGVLSLTQDLGDLALDLLARGGDGLELCLLGHACQGGRVLEEREVDLLEPEERGGFAHVFLPSLCPAGHRYSYVG